MDNNPPLPIYLPLVRSVGERRRQKSNRALVLIMNFIFNRCSATVVALDEAIMQAHLQAGAALLGNYVNSSSNLTDWMAAIDDSTSVKTMSIMGTHDSLTCAFFYRSKGRTS